MPINEEMAMQARKEIFSFILDILKELEEIYREPYGSEGLLVLEEMLQPLGDAWEEFGKDFDLEKAKDNIFKTSDQTLQDHGIYGAQAKAKKSLFNIRLKIFKGDRTKKTLLWLLDAIDTYLDSIVDATGLGTALKEIKDVLRSSIG